MEQNPFIMNGSVKENILFLSSFSASSYEEVKRKTELYEEIESFHQKDDTQLGEVEKKKQRKKERIDKKSGWFSNFWRAANAHSVSKSVIQRAFFLSIR